MTKQIQLEVGTAVEKMAQEIPIRWSISCISIFLAVLLNIDSVRDLYILTYVIERNVFAVVFKLFAQYFVIFNQYFVMRNLTYIFSKYALQRTSNNLWAHAPLNIRREIQLTVHVWISVSQIDIHNNIRRCGQVQTYCTTSLAQQHYIRVEISHSCISKYSEYSCCHAVYWVPDMILEMLCNYLTAGFIQYWPQISLCCCLTKSSNPTVNKPDNNLWQTWS
jgi:hypothetical protein